ncbi:MAG: NfeD family protein [Pseudomonadota bacterium]
MRRYSRIWWLSILLSSTVTGGSAFVLLSLLTSLPLGKVLIASVLLALTGDLVLALVMETVAPTHVKLGPGERQLDSELPSEPAYALVDFDDTGRGTVSARGETWQAQRPNDSSHRIAAGDRVQVVCREALTLIVRRWPEP